jgi:hypothetical protein
MLIGFTLWCHQIWQGNPRTSHEDLQLWKSMFFFPIFQQNMFVNVVIPIINHPSLGLLIITMWLGWYSPQMVCSWLYVMEWFTIGISALVQQPLFFLVVMKDNWATVKLGLTLWQQEQDVDVVDRCVRICLYRLVGMSWSRTGFPVNMDYDKPKYDNPQ